MASSTFFHPYFSVSSFTFYLVDNLREKHLFRWEGRNKIGIDQLIDYQIEAIEEDTLEFRLDDTAHYKDMIYLHLRNNHAVLTQDNDVQVFNDGAAKFDALIHDLEKWQKIIFIFNIILLDLIHLEKEF